MRQILIWSPILIFLKLILCVWCIRLLIAVIGKEGVAFFQL